MLIAAALPLGAQVTVAGDGSGDFRTVQAAVDAAPAAGSAIRIRAGVYREHLTIGKPHIALIGLGAKPADVVLMYDLSAGTAGGTTKSASTTISGSDFLAENLTFENSFSRNKPLTQEGSQAVAVKVTGDRAVFRRVRFLGFQDTLYANGAGARQYFEDCYIEGNVDFIFGNSLAWFEHCEIHALAHSQIMLTAQSKLTAEEKSGYVFDHCRVTAGPGADRIWLGRPWRAYAAVTFLHTELPAQIVPAGWSEWMHDGKPSLPTVSYAEFDSRGPGANPKARDPHSKQLTAAEAGRLNPKSFLAGDDGWDPTGVRP
ncbi:MAG TPA: pectinesterase family protein [Candidatus Limnocylindrales bacterium]|nr:pectinesterase family protein [Candidatus Limnocylindrales bacterium]